MAHESTSTSAPETADNTSPPLVTGLFRGLALSWLLKQYVRRDWERYIECFEERDGRASTPEPGGDGGG